MFLNGIWSLIMFSRKSLNSIHTSMPPITSTTPSKLDSPETQIKILIFNDSYTNFYRSKKLLSPIVSLFVCPIITHEPLDRFALIWNRENHGNVKMSSLVLSWFTYIGKTAIIVICVHARVSSGSSYEYLGQRWALKLVDSIK